MKASTLRTVHLCILGIMVSNTLVSEIVHGPHYQTVCRAGLTLLIATILWPRAMWLVYGALVCALASEIWPVAHHESWVEHFYARTWVTVTSAITFAAALLRYRTIRLIEKREAES